MGIDVGEKVRDFSEKLVKGKIYTQQSEIVSDALRQLFIKYRKEVSIEEVREITRKASEKVGRSLSEEVAALREEIG
jgi:Arc/MetJ-type ribon-helix-helix transcriptional regulator